MLLELYNTKENIDGNEKKLKTKIFLIIMRHYYKKNLIH